jgi:hypothetical protein
MDAWCLVPFFGLVAWALFYGHYRWAKRRLHAWARDNNLQIVQVQYRMFFRGPFTVLGKYEVFRICVKDAQGEERIGWVRLGGFFVGLWSEDSKVIWNGIEKEDNELH